MIKETVIMQISDLHFGLETTNRNEILASFLSCFSKFKSSRYAEWKPDILVISGDISYQGRANGYQEAKNYLEQICEASGIAIDHIVICPGNHDASCDGRGCPVPEENKQIPEKNGLQILDDDHIVTLSEKFKNYSDFCKELGVVPFENKTGKYGNYLYGYRKIDHVNFLVINTEWDFFGKIFEYDGSVRKYEKRLRAGCQFVSETVEVMKNSEWREIKRVEPIVAVMHRPIEDLHITEKDYYTDPYDRTTLKILKSNAHILLHGHMHQHCRESSEDDLKIFSCGAFCPRDVPFSEAWLIKLTCGDGADNECSSVKYIWEPPCGDLVDGDWNIDFPSIKNFNLDGKGIGKRLKELLYLYKEVATSETVSEFELERLKNIIQETLKVLPLDIKLKLQKYFDGISKHISDNRRQQSIQDGANEVIDAKAKSITPQCIVEPPDVITRKIDRRDTER